MVGFFLPWVNGSAEFASRDFSGFDLARLMRNFEIVSSSSSEAGRFTLTAVVLYLAPALAVNGALFAWAAEARRLAAVGLVLGGVYAAAVLIGVVGISVVDWTEAERVLGGLMAGFACSALGSVALLTSALLLVRAPAAAAAEAPPPGQAPSSDESTAGRPPG